MQKISQLIRTLPDKLPPNIRFLLSVYFIGMIFFAFFRIILVAYNLRQLHNIPFDVTTHSFLIGALFDTVVSSYILFIPLLFTSTLELAKLKQPVLKKILLWYLLTTYSIVFFACTADVPYYNNFNSRLTIAVFNWISTPTLVLKTLFQNIQFYPFMFLLALSIASYYLVLKRIIHQWHANEISNKTIWYFKLPFFLIATILLIVGIRGRISPKSPIRWGTAFFSQYSFPNQLGLNPAFTLVRSGLDAMSCENQTLQFMNDYEAIYNVQRFMNIPPNSPNDSPIARKIMPQLQPNNYNVVLVVMENISASEMGQCGAVPSHTKFLDSLADRSSFFRQCYSSGTRTSSGVFSTLFGYPALMSYHPMKATANMQLYACMSSILQKNNYSTIFMSSHDEQYENMTGFLSNNGFEKTISQKDFASDDVRNAFGVPDEVLFGYAIKKINNLNQAHKPFFTTILTSSNHDSLSLPNPLPSGFHPHSATRFHQSYEYADWSISQFIELAQKEDWFENTIFVFVADHGSNNQQGYDLPLNVHHIPFLIYAPTIFHEPKTYDNMVSQIDVFPTIMGLLNIPFTNSTFGIDLFREKRKFVYFSSDDKIGCMNDNFFLIIHKNGEKELFEYQQHSTTNYVEKYPQIADTMALYAKSMLQTAQWVIANHKVK